MAKKDLVLPECKYHHENCFAFLWGGGMHVVN